VTNRTDEIKTALSALATTVTGHKTHAEAFAGKAEQQAEIALEHGWDGVSLGYTTAGAYLTQITAEIESLGEHLDHGIEALDQIHDDTALDDVATHLTTADSHLASAVTTLDSILNNLDTVKATLEATGEENLATILAAFITDAQTTEQGIRTTRTDITAEIATANALAQGPSGGNTPTQRQTGLTAPDVDDGESLRGATKAQVADAARRGGWTFRGRSRDGNGDVWIHPNKYGEQIIINDGYPGAKDPTHAGPYVKLSRNGTKQRYPLTGEDHG
jgi:hypothetical protein